MYWGAERTACLRLSVASQDLGPGPSARDGWADLRLVEADGPPGPVLEGDQGKWKMRIPAGWRGCREKELAALRRTIASAALEVAVSETPAAILAEEVLLCGLPAMLAARRVGAKLMLRLSNDEVGTGLFDERLLPVLESCLRAAAAVLVPNQASVDLVAGYCYGGERVVVVPDGEDAAEHLMARLFGRRGSPDRVPWPRKSIGRIPVSRPQAQGRELEYVEEVIRSGWWGYGPVARYLEDRFRQSLDAPGALALSSCTAALHLSLEALNLRPEDEVVVPAMTFVSTAMAVVLAGGTPRLADVDPRTLAVTAESVDRLLGRRTRAVIVVHFAGVPADLGPLEELLAPRSIPIIEDAAHALGSSRNGRLAGAGSPFACFSFAPTKSVAAGAGGMLVFRDPELERMLRRRSNVGLSVDTLQRDRRADAPGNRVEDIGWRYRMDDLTAAVAAAQLELLEAKRQSRALLVARYAERLAGHDHCRPLLVPPGVDPVWYIFPILVPEQDRDAIRHLFAEAGIDTSVHYPNLAEQRAFSHLGDRTPVAAEVSRRVLSLPLHEGLHRDDVDRVCDVLESHFGSTRRTAEMA